MIIPCFEWEYVKNYFEQTLIQIYDSKIWYQAYVIVM